MRTAIARWIMDRAIANPPPGRNPWARAMAGEFAAMQDGHLGWALGCWAVATGWRLRSEWLYLALLVLAPGPLQLGAMFAALELMGDAGRDQRMLWLPYQVLGPPMLISLALGAYRPGMKSATALGVALIPLLGGELVSWFTMQVAPTAWWGPNSTLFMAPPLVGLCALLGVCYFGAAMGARFAQRRPS